VRIRIVTYNIHRAIGVDRRFRPERIVNIAAHYDPDVLLLQEVDEGAPRSRETHLGRDIAEALGYPHFVVGHNVSLRRGRYGNATLSRYPILRERNIDLTIDSRKRRGCQHTTLEIEKVAGHPRKVDVFNLHLGLMMQERVRQIGLLVRSSEFSDLDRQQPSIVGGDFNDWRSLLYPIFTEVLGFECATTEGRRYGRVLRTFPSFSPRGGLDRIYYRGPIRVLSAQTCRLRLSRVASDHLPVIADFELY
jgi:endonuclease/exonuclease/phosphatase family metal-dependent hydrolase